MNLLAAATAPATDELLRTAPATQPAGASPVVLIAGLVLAALAILLGLLVYFLKRERRRAVPDSAGETSARHSGRRRRRRRRSRRQRNPTLAETGGLPPIRPQNQPPAGL